MALMPFKEQELSTISQIQILIKKINQLDKKMKTAKARCDEANSVLNIMNTERQKIMDAVIVLKSKLVQDMKAYDQPTKDLVVVAHDNDQIGRLE